MILTILLSWKIFFNYKEQKVLVYEFILSVIPFPVILIPQEQCRDK